MNELQKKQVRNHTIIGTILVMILLLGTGYIVFNKVFNPKETKSKKETSKVEKIPEKKKTYAAKLDDTKPYIYITETYEIPGAYTAGDSIQTAYINIKDKEAITNLNNELKQYSETLKQAAVWRTDTTGQRELYEYVKSTTTISIQDDIASMVIVSPTVAQGDNLPVDLKTYTIDLKTGSVLSEDELLTRYGIKKDQFITLAKSKMKAAGYLNTNEGNWDDTDEASNQTIKGYYMDDNIMTSLLYINENKKLSLLIKILPGMFSNMTVTSIELSE